MIYINFGAFQYFEQCLLIDTKGLEMRFLPLANKKQEAQSARITDYERDCGVLHQ